MKAQRIHRAWCAVLVTITLGLTLGLAQGHAAEKIDVLIIDGQNNHNWRETTPVLHAILESVPVFAVSVATTPGNLAEFKPDFSKYDVVVSNYNGGDWPSETKKAFVDFVRGGGGFVSVHAADNSFPKWPEYNEMIGVGGWGGRNEKDGPWIYWEDGKFHQDNSKGAGGGHGRQHAFQIVNRDTTHPITKGLPTEWMHARDELYSNLRGPAKNLKILATAFAAKNTGGTGRHEPQLMVVPYGKGRVFHTTLGHAVPALKCVGFAFTLQRGTEWAATGKVVHTAKVPADFPTADKVVVWVPPPSYAKVRSYDFGDDRSPLTAIEAHCRGASTEKLAEIEKELLAILTAPETKYAGKQFVVRVLRRIGSAACVPAFEKLLTDKELSHNARWVLQGLPAKEATAALLRGLAACGGDQHIGVIGSLGGRGDRSVVPAIANLLTAKDPKVALAAIKALRLLGGEEAISRLTKAEIHPDFALARDDAILTCAESLIDEGKFGPAADHFRSFAMDEKRTPLLRLAGYRGLVSALGPRSVPALVELLDHSDATLSGGARRLLRHAKGRESTVAITSALLTATPARQARLIDTLLERGNRAAGPKILPLLESEDAATRLAAVRALGSLGDATCAQPLSDLAVEDSETGRAAFTSLTQLQGKGVVRAFQALGKFQGAPVRVKIIEVLAARGESGANDLLLKSLKDLNAPVRTAAAKALGKVGGRTEFQVICVFISSEKSDKRTSALVAVARAIAERFEGEDFDAASKYVSALVAKLDPAKRSAFHSVLSIFSTDEALEAIVQDTKSSNAADALAAVRALTSWRNAKPLATLLALAKDPATPEIRTAALAGYTTKLSMPANRPAAETAKLLDEAMGLAKTDDERRKIVSRFSQFPCKESVAFLEKLEKDAALTATVKPIAREIRGILVRNSLVGTASHNANEWRRALDGNQSSRWSTGTPMRPGMWFQVDLGVEKLITSVMLDCRSSPGDYPRGSEVYVSFDGKTWGQPVAKSKPQRPITRLKLDQPTRGRFVRIVQTGETDGLFWSIHNLRVKFE